MGVDLRWEKGLRSPALRCVSVCVCGLRISVQLGVLLLRCALHGRSGKLVAMCMRVCVAVQGVLDGSDEDGSDGDSDSSDEPPRPDPFPEVEAAINDAIADYDSVFPRLNWSAPTVRWRWWNCPVVMHAWLASPRATRKELLSGKPWVPPALDAGALTSNRRCPHGCPKV